MKKILIVGATSAIAEATARRYAREGASLYLLARNAERLDSLARDLRIRGAGSVGHAGFEAGELGAHEARIEQAILQMDGIDIALIAHGTLGDQKACEKNVALTLRELNTNLVSTVSLLTHLANRFEAQGHGSIAVIGSVAGERGRQSNYVYGTAKGALSIFLQGLRNRMHKKGVHVLTIKPGFVDTPMTAAFNKGPLWSSPDAIAAAIERAIDKKKDEIYAPWWWGGIMFVIKSIPERLFKRLSL